MTTDHQLANLRQRELKLSQTRRDILAQDSETALDMILEAPSPATLIQSFPDEDLYYLMNHIGGADFLPVLALATSSQWEYILDMEVWDDDRLDTQVMTQALELLFKADAQRLLRWIIKEKPGYFEFFLYQNMEIVIREHDELPPEDHQDYVTIDDKFYFRFPHVKAEAAGEDEEGDEVLTDEGDDDAQDRAEDSAELIEKMVKKLAEMDLSVYHGLLQETQAILPSEVEEEEFRLKNVRLAEKGFLPPHEAVGIYQPTSLDNLRQRPEIPGATPENFDPDQPLPPQCFSQLLKGENRFIKTLALVAPERKLDMESELAALVNKVISADRIKIRERETLEMVLGQTTAFLSLGLETLAHHGAPDTDPDELSLEESRQILDQYFLEDLFRTGSRAGIQLKQRAVAWYGQSYLSKQNLPLSFLGESYLGVLGGLFLDRPRFFDNYQTSKEIYAHFSTLNQVETTRNQLEEIMAVDKLLGSLDADISGFSQGVLTYKSMLLSLWSRERMGLEPTLAPIPMENFTPFFKALFAEGATIGEFQHRDIMDWALEAWNRDAETPADELPRPLPHLLKALLAELGDEYGAISTPDPRYIPHFLLAH
ncbi:MAG: DUF6178 family protein [Desulfobacterales bacterium]|nr:DUF6178 family protein [Desulfobacterales bacterium]